MSSTAATVIEALPEGDPNPSYFANVDPSDICARFDSKGRANMAGKHSDSKKMFTIISPPLEVVWPVVTGEGNFGKQVNRKGDEQTDRSKATFTLSLRVGTANMDDVLEVNPKLHDEQVEFFRKIYVAGRALLKNIYAQHPEEFIPMIMAARTKVRADRLLIEKGAGSSIKTDADLLKAMAADRKLRAEIESEYCTAFVDNAAYMFMDPSEFDETGCKTVVDVSESGKEETRIVRLGVGVKRKVWRAKDWKAKHVMSTAYLPGTPETWHLALNAMSRWTYNCYSYFDPSANNGKGATVKRPTYRPPNYEGAPIDDAFWDPFKDSSSLVQMTLYIQPFTFQSTHGVKVVPNGSVTVVRQTEYVKKAEAVGLTQSLATGMRIKQSAPDDDSSSTNKRSASDDDSSSKRTKLNTGVADDDSVASVDYDNDVAAQID